MTVTALRTEMQSPHEPSADRRPPFPYDSGSPRQDVRMDLMTDNGHTQRPEPRRR
jgi:hypothetical protein